MKLNWKASTTTIGAMLILSASAVFAACSPTWGVPATWEDTNGSYINAHGGGILSYEGKYYWFGECRPTVGEPCEKGISCYSSTNLREWDYEGIAFTPSEREGDATEMGCVMERPKVVYCPQTGKFVMWFHLELKGQGYAAARAAVAVSDAPTGPYQLISSGRVNPGIAPTDPATVATADSIGNLGAALAAMEWSDSLQWWTPDWYEAVKQGMFVKRDLEGGQMSRDMTIYVDDDGKAYHIYSSEENLTLHIAELTDDYQAHTGRYIRIYPTGHNEAPTIFKREGTYWMITSGCTGWKPNEARMFSAPSIYGPWEQHPTPFKGEGADTTFGGQGTYILPLPDGQFLFMADIWTPDDLMHSGYMWLPIGFDEQGVPTIARE